MFIATILIWALALLLGAVAFARSGGAHRTGLRIAFDQFVTVVPPMIMGVLTATFLGALIPGNMIASWLGAETGIAGIFIASVVGGLVPGGPVLTYPLAVVLMQTGAGVPQITAFLAAWSVFALHRVISYEVPLMGWQFSAVRLLASLALPLAAGLLAGLLVSAAGLRTVPTPLDPSSATRLAVGVRTVVRADDPSMTLDRGVYGRQK